MIKWPSAFIEQFFKDVDKVPGWVPLYLSVYVALEYSSVAPALRVRGRELEMSTAVAATLLTFVLYQLGDAMDEVVYKVRRGRRTYTRPRYLLGYRSKRRDAQRILGQTAGIYDLSLALVNVAEKDRPVWFVHGLNELAKYLRSVAVASLVLFPIALMNARPYLAYLALVIGVSAFYAYPWLKVCHTRKLYCTVIELATLPKFAGALTVTALAGVRVVFWRGRLVQVSAA